MPNNEFEVLFLYDIKSAANDSNLNDKNYNGLKLKFSKSTLHRIGAQAENVLCFPACGNSMEPVIPDGTIVAVDTANKRISNGSMYAINQKGVKRIRLLYCLPGGKLGIGSHNKIDFPDEEASEIEVEIIGRVFWTSTLW